MGKGKPRTTRAATDARKAVLDALQAGEPLPEPEARELVDRLIREERQTGYSAGWDDGHHYGTWGD